jgi:hypothetical protein
MRQETKVWKEKEKEIGRKKVGEDLKGSLRA